MKTIRIAASVPLAFGFVLACGPGCGSSEPEPGAPSAPAAGPVPAAPPTEQPAGTYVPTTARPSSFVAPSTPSPAAAPSAPRDLGAEVRAGMGDVAGCFGPPSPGAPAVDVLVDVSVKADGSVEVWRVSGDGLSSTSSSCLRGLASAVRLDPPIEGAPRVASARLAIPGVGAAVPSAPPSGSPPAPAPDPTRRLPPGFTWGNQAPGVPISGPQGDRIQGPAGDRIQGPAGDPISGPQGAPIQGPRGVTIGDPSL